MLTLKRILIFAIVALILVFCVQNQMYLGQKVELNFYGWHATLILGVWLVIAFAAGFALYMAIDLPRTFSLKSKLRRKTHEAARAQAEIDRLAAERTPPEGNRPTT